MTKLTAPAVKRLTALGIKAKDEESAVKEIGKRLAKEGLEGMEGEDLETLLDMIESIVETPTEEVEDEEEADVEEVAEEDEEEEAPAPKKKAAVVPVKPASKAVPAKPTKKVVVEEEEDEEEEVAPVKKGAVKPIAKPITKTAPVAAKPTTKTVPAKPVAKNAAKVALTKSTKLNPQKNEEDRDHFDVLKTIFPEKNYIYAWIASNGVTVKYKGKNSNRSVTSLENATLHDDGTITCNCYMQTFGKKKDSLVDAGIDFQVSWSQVPFLKNISLDEAMEVLTQFLPEIEASVGKLDKKLGENRTKMEESLKKGNEKANVKPAKKAAAVVEEEDDEEDEVEEAPVAKKKVVPAPVAKKAAPAPAKPIAKVIPKKK